jgi:hypothetical protein
LRRDDPDLDANIHGHFHADTHGNLIPDRDLHFYSDRFSNTYLDPDPHFDFNTNPNLGHYFHANACRGLSGGDWYF